jgi:hypothetical protein
VLEVESNKEQLHPCGTVQPLGKREQMLNDGKIAINRIIDEAGKGIVLSFYHMFLSHKSPFDVAVWMYSNELYCLGDILCPIPWTFLGAILCCCLPFTIIDRTLQIKKI